MYQPHQHLPLLPLLLLLLTLVMAMLVQRTSSQDCLSFTLSLTSDMHQGITGTYRAQPRRLNNRPVYKHACSELYAFYSVGHGADLWMIGPNVGQRTAHALSYDAGYHVTSQTAWRMWNHERDVWQGDDGAHVLCAELCEHLDISSSSSSLPSTVPGRYSYYSTHNGRPAYRKQEGGGGVTYLYHHVEEGGTCERWSVGYVEGDMDAIMYMHSSSDSPTSATPTRWTSTTVPYPTYDDVMVTCAAASTATPPVGGGGATTTGPPIITTPPQPSTMCGTRPIPNAGAAIVGGQNVPYHGKWPFMVAMLRPSGSFKCGGAVLNSRWVLTAGHCIQDGSSWEGNTLYFGSHDTRFQEAGERQTATIKRAIVHPDFGWTINPFFLDNDFALLELNQPLTYTNYVQPVCLAGAQEQLPYSDVQNHQSQYSNCYMVGWGRTSQAGTPGGTPGGILQEATVRLLTLDPCINSYLQAYRSWGPNTQALCVRSSADEDSAKICEGDSGSPLVCQNTEGRWTLIGAASWSIIECRNPISNINIPSVYADATQFNQWILQYINT